MAPAAVESQQCQAVLSLIDTLLDGPKRLDDRAILTECTIENRACHMIGNSEVIAITASASIYRPPALQAALDFQLRIFQAEDKDDTPAYSTPSSPLTTSLRNALATVEYMSSCKVMLNLPDHINSLPSIKLVAKYAQLRDVEIMHTFPRAQQKRSWGAVEGL